MSLAAKKDSASISVLPGTDERTLCVSYKNHISAEDYQEYFVKPLKAITDVNPNFSLLIHYDQSYKGWDKDAADLSFKNILENAPNARKLAYVNPPESKIFQVKMVAPVFGGEVRFFNQEELDEATTWVKS